MGKHATGPARFRSKWEEEDAAIARGIKPQSAPRHSTAPAVEPTYGSVRIHSVTLDSPTGTPFADSRTPAGMPL